MAKYTTNDSIDQFAAVTRALSDRSRIRAFHALRRGELCVCQIVELLGLATSTVSRHMAVLREAGLVEARKEGRWMYYRRAAVPEGEQVAMVIEALDRGLARDSVAREDDRSLRGILSLTPEELCRRQGLCREGESC